MIFKAHNEFVIIDIGEKYIKAMLSRTNWDGSIEYVYATKLPSKGIFQNTINNLRSLSDVLFQAIYRIEIDVGTTVKSVVIIFSFCNFEVKNFNTNITINGIVQEHHIQNINYRMNFGLNKSILGYLLKNYKLDALQNIEDPLHMCGINLSLNSIFLAVESDIIRNLITSFNRNEINVEFLGCGNLLNKTLINEQNFASIDVGYSSTRVLIQINTDHIIDFFVISSGFKDLLNILQKITGHTIEKCEQMISIFYEDSDKVVVDECRKFFKNLFYIILLKLQKFEIFNKSDLNIYLYGGIATVPLIDMFLQQNFDRNFLLLNIVQKFSSIYNKNIFSNIVGCSKYIVSNTELKYLSKIENTN